MLHWQGEEERALVKETMWMEVSGNKAEGRGGEGRGGEGRGGQGRAGEGRAGQGRGCKALWGHGHRPGDQAGGCGRTQDKDHGMEWRGWAASQGSEIRRDRLGA